MARCHGGVSFGIRSRVGVVRAGTSVLTASRVEEGSAYVRVMGPGKSDVNGMQRISSLFSDLAMECDFNGVFFFWV
jgi:hypothetical protein